MPDGGNDRDIRIVDRPRDTLVIERPQILDRTAAAAGDDEVADPIAVGIPDRSGDLRRCLRPLHAHGQQHDLAGRPALTEHADDIAHGRTRRRRDDSDPLRKQRQWLFVRAVKQALLLQLLLELLVGGIQVAHTARNEPRTIELICPVARIDRDAADGRNAHSARRAKAQRLRAAAKHHAPQAALGILEREIMMPGRVDLVVGQFPRHTDITEQRIRIQQLLDVSVELRYGKGCTRHVRLRRRSQASAPVHRPALQRMLLPLRPPARPRRAQSCRARR